jgi:homoserine kinase type II
MALLTPLSHEEARATLDAYGLTLESIVPLAAHGTVNSNFRVRASGREWFLRVNEGKRDADVVAEAELVTELRAGGLPTPEIVRTRAGGWFATVHKKPVTLFPWTEGREAAPRADDPSSVEVAGRALALLHRAGAQLDPARLPRNYYSLDELERRLASFSGDRRFGDALPLLTDELARARRREQASFPSGLIHQDLFPDNLLVDAQGNLVAVLDLEQATHGRFSYDLAVAITSWCWNGREHVAHAMDAMRAAYESVRPLDRVEVSALRDEMCLAAARFTITRITDVFLPEGVDPDLKRRKDYRDFLSRLADLRSRSKM